ncbi:MAG: AI-2E family transporter [candidate division WOR-3 bacterium]
MMRGPPSFYEAGADWASRFFWLLWRLAILTLVLYLLWRVQHVVALLLVSGAFAYILSPIVDYLCRWRPPKITPFFWRGLVTFFTIVAFLFLILWGLKAFLTPFIEETRKFVQNFDQHRQRVEGAIRDIQLSYQQWYESLPPNSQRWLSQQQRALQEATTGFWNHLDGWVQQLGKQTGVWLTFLVELLILPVIVFYLVLDASPSQRRLGAASLSPLGY